jgi:hypothetical protein
MAALRRSGYDVWGADTIEPGQSIDSAIADAVTSADVAVIILTRAFGKSAWAATETSLFLWRYFSDGRFPVIPVRLDRDAEVPALLRRLMYLDLSDVHDTDTLAKEIGRSIAQAGKGLERSSALPSDVLDIEHALLESERATFELTRGERSKYFEGLFGIVLILSMCLALLAAAASAFSSNKGIFTPAGILVSILLGVVASAAGFYFGRTGRGDRGG